MARQCTRMCWDPSERDAERAGPMASPTKGPRAQAFERLHSRLEPSAALTAATAAISQSRVERCMDRRPWATGIPHSRKGAPKDFHRKFHAPDAGIFQSFAGAVSSSLQTWQSDVQGQFGGLVVCLVQSRSGRSYFRGDCGNRTDTSKRRRRLAGRFTPTLVRGSCD